MYVWEKNYGQNRIWRNNDPDQWAYNSVVIDVENSKNIVRHIHAV